MSGKEQETIRRFRTELLLEEQAKGGARSRKDLEEEYQGILARDRQTLDHEEEEEEPEGEIGDPASSPEPVLPVLKPRTLKARREALLVDMLVDAVAARDELLRAARHVLSQYGWDEGYWVAQYPCLIDPDA